MATMRGTAGRFEPGEPELRRAVVDTALEMSRCGLSPGRSGNVSARLGTGMLITPSAKSYGTLSPADVVYVMAGLPEKRAEFAALAESLGVAQALRFTGLAEDALLPALYDLADVFVLVSRRTAAGDVEGYGIVVQEAALCGTPAVVSRGCGLTEAIREGETGVSVPPDDPEATAAALIALLGDDAARGRMGARARELAARATWAERAADYDDLLRRLLPQETGHRPLATGH